MQVRFRQSKVSNAISIAFVFIMGLAPCLIFGADHNPQITVTLDGTGKGRIYDGIGAVSAGASSRLLIDYPEPQRSKILDYLFKPGYGAALQHLKVEIGADVNSTDGSEPSYMRTASDHDSSRGYEWWLMSEARKRNPKIILEVLPWGAPRWVGSTLNGKDSLYSSRTADYVADFIRTAKRAYGLDISYAGIWNERMYDLAYIKELQNRFKADHLPTRIICCDGNPGEGDGQWSIAREVLKDSELAAAIDVIGVHYPFWDNGIKTTDAARKTGKPLWSSEDQPNGGGGPFVSREWAVGGRILAHVYNRNFLEGALTSTEIWSPVTSYYDILAAPNSGLMYANTPWSGHYDVQGNHLGYGAHHPIRTAGLAVSRFRIGISSGERNLCHALFTRQEELERRAGNDRRQGSSEGVISPCRRPRGQGGSHLGNK